MPTPTPTLTDRYIDAAMRTVPEAQRADLAAELRGSIDDQIDARVENGEEADAAERAVLTELGDPDTLAAGYTDRPLWLIGPRYYLAWWRLTKLLWAIVPACAAFGVALAQVLDGASIGEVIGAVIPVVIQVIVNVGFWTAVVFFIVERATRGADVGFVGPWTLDRLPEQRERGAKLSDMIATLVWLLIIAGALVWDHLLGVIYLTSAGGWISFFNDGLWPWWISGLFVVLIVEALVAIWVYARGRWTMPLAWMNAALNAVVALPALWLLTEGLLINPEFFTLAIPADSAETVANVAPIVLGFGIAGVAIGDSIDAFVKARRSTTLA